jgi:hypothetical protein
MIFIENKKKIQNDCDNFFNLIIIITIFFFFTQIIVFIILRFCVYHMHIIL